MIKLQSKNCYPSILVIISIILLSLNLNATNYYVSASGSDSNAGTSEDKPWKTLAKVNSFTLKPGDQILFKRGDSWVGTITPKASGISGSVITYGAYGSGDKPKIFGSEKVTGWTKHSGNIYKTSINKSDIKQLFLNDKRMQLARYPNEGYFTMTSVNSSTQFVSTELNGSMNYKGATCLLRNKAFSLLSMEVTSSSSQTVNINSAPMYPLKAGYGFWLANKLEFLNSAGEWFYDNSNNVLYFWTPGGDSPSNYEVRVTTIDKGVYISKKDYINIKDLEILHSGTDGIKIDFSLYNKIENCNIVDSDVNGICFDDYSCKNTTVKNCIVHGANSKGILAYSHNAVIVENTIEETGQLSNINKVADGMIGIGVSSRYDNAIIENNRILNCGYSGINFQGLNTTVRYNYVDGACQTLDDGGGIYGSAMGTYPNNTRTLGSVIDHNIVLNVFGNKTGSLNTNNDSGVGIYLDWEPKDITVTNNTISGTTYGVYVRAGGLHKIKYNTIFDGMLLLRFKDESLESDVIEFKHNILYQTSRLGKHSYVRTETHQKLVWPNETGTTFDNDFNTYIAPYYSKTIFKGSADFEDWKSDTGTDANSTFNDDPMESGETEKLFINDTKIPKIFNLGTSTFEDIHGKLISGSFTLDPFTSKILIGKDFDKIDSEEDSGSENKLGSTEVFNSVSTSPTKRAVPYTINETGVINSITIYHNGGAGKVLLGVYSDQSGVPESLIGITPAVNVNSSEGWQTVDLSNPVSVTTGQTVWLAWVFENNPGIRYTSGKPGRASSSDTWQNQLTSDFGKSSIADYIYSIYCSYSSNGENPQINKGNTQVYNLVSTGVSRRAMPVTFNETGEINSISVYHNGGTGKVLLGVYSDNSGAPETLLSVTPSISVSSKEGWQTISLSNPVKFDPGQTVWLAFVFEESIAVRYSTGTPGRALSYSRWDEGMPTTFGSSTIANYKYSIYCTYTVNLDNLKKTTIPDENIIEPVATIPTELNSTVNNESVVLDILEEEQIDFKLYPNPASSYIEIDFLQIPVSDSKLVIFDSNGRLILNQQILSSTNTVDLSNFSSGLYFVKVVNQQKTITKKLIINK